MTTREDVERWRALAEGGMTCGQARNALTLMQAVPAMADWIADVEARLATARREWAAIYATGLAPYSVHVAELERALAEREVDG